METILRSRDAGAIVFVATAVALFAIATGTRSVSGPFLSPLQMATGFGIALFLAAPKTKLVVIVFSAWTGSTYMALAPHGGIPHEIMPELTEKTADPSDPGPAPHRTPWRLRSSRSPARDPGIAASWNGTLRHRLL